MSNDGVAAEAFEIRVRGSSRRYLVIRPHAVDPATVATVIDLHGSGSSPEEHVAVTSARSSAAVVVVPQAGIPFRLQPEWPAGWAWNVPGSPLPGESTARNEPDDVAFMDTLTTRLIERHGVDPGRIHLRGFSGGARLGAHLIVAMAQRLASVCFVGGARFAPSSGDLPPVLAMHGGLDPLNPYEGGEGPRWSESVESAVYRWAVASGCGPMPRYRILSDNVREACYVNAAGFAAVRLITVADAAHSWPGTTHADHIGQFGDPGSFDASGAHWDFVREVDESRHRTAGQHGPTAGRPS